MRQTWEDRRLKDKNKKFSLEFIEFEVPDSHPHGCSWINKYRIQARSYISRYYFGESLSYKEYLKPKDWKHLSTEKYKQKREKSPGSSQGVHSHLFEQGKRSYKGTRLT